MEHKVLVRTDKDEDDDKGAANDQRVRQDGQRSGSKHRCQVDPPSDRWRQFTDALRRRDRMEKI